MVVWGVIFPVEGQRLVASTKRGTVVHRGGGNLWVSKVWGYAREKASGNVVAG